MDQSMNRLHHALPVSMPAFGTKTFVVQLASQASKFSEDSSSDNNIETDCDTTRGIKYPNSNEDSEEEITSVDGASDIGSHDCSTFVTHRPRLSETSIMSHSVNYSLTRTIPTVNKGKGKAMADFDSDSDFDYEESVTEESSYVVGDQLLDIYPDRNLGETGFPHIGDSQNTPVLQAIYDRLRAEIFHAVDDDNFRNGHFKADFTPGRSIQSIILDMQLSGEVSRGQFDVLFRFGRGWAKAICESAKWEYLDQKFIDYVALELAVADLMAIFEQEKFEPLPYPLPDCLKYKDPKTMREEFEACGLVSDAKDDAPAGYISVKDAMGGSSSSASGASAKPGPSAYPGVDRSTLQQLGITRAIVLATLAEYSAATSPDRVLRNAWAEISNLKEIDAKAMDNMSDETLQLIHNYLQSVATGKNIPMPMGTAFDTTLARLEAFHIRQAEEAAANPRSDLYAPPPPEAPEKKPSLGKRVKNKMNKKSRKTKPGKGKGKK